MPMQTLLMQNRPPWWYELFITITPDPFSEVFGSQVDYRTERMQKIMDSRGLIKCSRTEPGPFAGS
jgi:hypothetical protein